MLSIGVFCETSAKRTGYSSNLKYFCHKCTIKHPYGKIARKAGIYMTFSDTAFRLIVLSMQNKMPKYWKNLPLMTLGSFSFPQDEKI